MSKVGRSFITSATSSFQQSPTCGNRPIGATSLHHLLTPTTSRRAPIAKRIDVTLGAIDTIRGRFDSIWSAIAPLILRGRGAFAAAKASDSGRRTRKDGTAVGWQPACPRPPCREGTMRNTDTKKGREKPATAGSRRPYVSRDYFEVIRARRRELVRPPLGLGSQRVRIGIRCPTRGGNPHTPGCNTRRTLPDKCKPDSRIFES